MKELEKVSAGWEVGSTDLPDESDGKRQSGSPSRHLRARISPRSTSASVLAGRTNEVEQEKGVKIQIATDRVPRTRQSSDPLTQ